MRHLQSRCILCRWSGSASLARSYASSLLRRDVAKDPAEAAREQALRGQIVAKYPRVNLPQYSSFTYGKYASTGATQSSTQGAQAAGRQSAQETIAQMFGRGGPVPPNGGAPPPPNEGASIDWLMLFAGTALVYVSSQVLFERFTTPTSGDNVIVPLWALPKEEQAIYLVYLMSFHDTVKSQLEQEYRNFRRSQPMVSFFEWLHHKYPMFGSGRRHSRAEVLDLVSHTLTAGGSYQLATLGRLASNAIANTNGDVLTNIDEFVDYVTRAGGGRSRGGPPLSNPYAAAPSSTGTPFPHGFPLHHPSSPHAQTVAPAASFPHSFAAPPPFHPNLSHGVQEVTLVDVLSSVQGKASEDSFGQRSSTSESSLPRAG